MEDEIKEILDNPKILMLSYGNYISLDDYVKLKDYITNLQEENNYYFKKNNELSTLNTSLRNDRDNYKQRNRKATEYMNNYIEVEDAPINERIKIEFKEVIRLLTGGDE